MRAARVQATPVLLMTFAYWEAPGYSKERFLAGKLAYGHGGFELPTEVWGKPENVVAALEAHNREIRQLAETEGVIFVDQAKQMPHDGRHFADICHLTDQGCRRFVENLMPSLRQRFAKPK